MNLSFTKMHGLGNDFMVLEGVRQALKITPAQIREWADRKTGIGFDQCLLVLPATTKDADFDYKIYNSDGSEAGQCGNGARCVTKFIRDQGLSAKDHLILNTRDRLLTCLHQPNGEVKVDMGQPRWLPEDACEFPYHAVDLGNPHAVIRVEQIDTFDLNTAARMIRTQPNFPDGVNVGAMQIIDSHHIRLRVNERGAGETAACGSGACAAMVVARHYFQANSSVRVTLTGGDLQVEWSGDLHGGVWMTGPATTVYQGSLPT